MYMYMKCAYTHTHTHTLMLIVGCTPTCWINHRQGWVFVYIQREENALSRVGCTIATSLSLSLSLSLSHTHTHTHTYTHTHALSLSLSLSFSLSLKGNLVDLHGKVLRYVDYNPDQQDPVYTGPLQVLGPGFAPFKPYVRPKHFYTRVSPLQSAPTKFIVQLELCLLHENTMFASM